MTPRFPLFLYFLTQPLSMPNSPNQTDLKALVNALNQRDNNIKTRRVRIDAIVDEDFTVLDAVYQQLAK
jgi:hypothetical protein